MIINGAHEGGVRKLIVNDDAIPFTGQYATSARFNLDYGVKLAYCPNGDIILSTQAASSGTYLAHGYALASAPDGVTLTANNYYTRNMTNVIFCCVLHGVTVPMDISLVSNSLHHSYYPQVDITLTAV